ncbi:DUF5007 domain-containing protein [Arachidicoccus soli]|uniref:DUF5007 domain-containing protein n=1 Tax=Arachidicoccus soli TaxID=2341117 RepID=A0A386HL82_9BACT|nr:DUF5007 domain-containing protein [Arachidicoccus soli]AYD46379.1 DUF5007 domain-containing protein [Arachidicoccus soli]
MKNIKVSVWANSFIILILCSMIMLGCTKIQNGFLSPTMQYSTHLFVAPQGQIASSNSLVADGSNLPLNVKWTHIYDSSGKNVDAMFLKTYPVGIWTQSYNPLTDTSYASIVAKRTTEELPPFTVNSTSGVISTNSATLYIPLGTYSLDLQVTNSAGTQELKNAISIKIAAAQPVQTADDGGIGSFSLSRLNAGTSGGAATHNGVTSVFYNGNFNPFVVYSVRRISDTPNVMIIKVTDRNGVVFNPKKGEIAKRPAGGLNPIPPYLQNLQYYAPDTFQALDSALYVKYPLTPFPIASLGNGFNMYYIIPTQYVHMDSTKSWSGNSAGTFYQGTSDSHYLGQFGDNLYDYALRIPLRIQTPGNYFFQIKLLDVTHR